MDSDPIEALIGHRCVLLLVEGSRIEGELQAADNLWWRLSAEEGEILVNPQHVAAVGISGGLPVTAGGGGGGKAAKRARGAAPGRPWADEQLKALADGFLDGETDKDLAATFGRTPAIIRQLRQAFEAARGNLDEDQLGEVAGTWVGRWRQVLAS
jgi:hypothetical protein